MVDGDVVDLDRFGILAKKRRGTPSMLASVGLRLRRIWLHDGQVGQFLSAAMPNARPRNYRARPPSENLRAEILALRNELATGLPQRNDGQI